MANQQSRKTMVQLAVKDSEPKRTRLFEISIANKLLQLSNSQWTLDDKGFKFEDEIKRNTSKGNNKKSG